MEANEDCMKDVRRFPAEKFWKDRENRGSFRIFEKTL